MPPILIVGAGPVGLTMALELSRYGVAVRLVDKAPQPTQTSKALVVWSRTLELLDRAGCTPGFLAAGLHGRGATVRKGAQVLGQTSFETVASHYNFALMIPQSETERLLAAHLETLGVTVEREVELTGFSDDGDHVAARLRHADGREERVETPYLLGCDGAHSAVRHGLGVAFDGAPQGDDWFLADVRLEGPGAPPVDEVAAYQHHDGPFIIFPMPGGRARVIACVGRTDPGHPRPDPTLEEVQAVVDRRTAGGFRVVDPNWLSNFHINERKVADYRVGRVFLSGDAAHIHSPFGGQGMNTGMQDAFGLAWRLALVSRGGPARLLDSYSAERSAVGDMVLANVTRLTDMATLKNPVAQAARNLAIRVALGFHYVRERMATQASEIEIAYARSPLSRGPHAGDRFAPEHYAGPPPGAGDDPRFVLYAADRARGAALTARYAGLLQAEVRAPAEAGQIAIVRPDAYLGFVGAADAWAEADAYLAALGQ